MNPDRQGGRARIGGWCWLALLALLAAPGHAQLADFPELSKRFSAAREPASYVIVIDMSGSMARNGYFAVVRRAVCDFVSALPAGDYLSVLGFNASTRQLVLPQRLGDDRRELVRLLESIKDPRPQSATAPEQYTDIGKALKQTVRELRAPGAPRIQFAFVLTDGKHEPAPGSEFATKTGRAWDALSKTARLALDDKLLQVTALSLGANTDIGLVQSIFPDATPVVVDRPALAAFFGRLKAEMQRDRLALLVDGELRAEPLQQLPIPTFSVRQGGSTRLPVALPPGSGRLGSTLDVQVLGSKGCAARVAAAQRPGGIGLLIDAPGRDRFWQIARSRPCSVQARMRLTAEPAAEIRRLGLEPVTSRDVTFSGRAQGGQPLTVLATVVLLGVLVVLVAVRQAGIASAPARLTGKLACIDGPGQLVLRGQARATLGGTDQDDLRLPGQAERAIAVLLAGRVPRSFLLRMLSWQPRSAVYLQHDGRVRVTLPPGSRIAVQDSVPVGGRAKQRLTNRAQLEIGAYRYLWEEHFDRKEAPGGSGR